MTPAGGNDHEGRKAQAISLPNPEVLAKPLRRRFTAGYKLRILKEVDALTDSGQIGVLLRREGLYSSHLTTWRRQREAGAIQALQPKKRGRCAWRRDPVIQENKQLRRENDRFARRLKKAEAIVEIQKNFRTPGDPPESTRARQGRLMAAATEIAPELGIARACEALGLAVDDIELVPHFDQ